jgi:hypothetical protein
MGLQLTSGQDTALLRRALSPVGLTPLGIGEWVMLLTGSGALASAPEALASWPPAIAPGRLQLL